MIESADSPAALGDVQLREIYYFMRLTRAMEDRTRTLFLQGCGLAPTQGA